MREHCLSRDHAIVLPRGWPSLQESIVQADLKTCTAGTTLRRELSATMERILLDVLDTTVNGGMPSLLKSSEGHTPHEFG